MPSAPEEWSKSFLLREAVVEPARKCLKRKTLQLKTAAKTWERGDVVSTGWFVAQSKHKNTIWGAKGDVGATTVRIEFFFKNSKKTNQSKRGGENHVVCWGRAPGEKNPVINTIGRAGVPPPLGYLPLRLLDRDLRIWGGKKPGPKRTRYNKDVELFTALAGGFSRRRPPKEGGAHKGKK